MIHKNASQASRRMEGLPGCTLAAAAVAVFMAGLGPACADQPGTGLAPGAAASRMGEIQAVAPALANYARDRVAGELWKRPGLALRDRSIVTASALIARNEVIDMPHHFSLALDHGVTPKELSEIVTHLAFYSGFPNAMAAVVAAKDVFARRGIGADQLPQASPTLLPLDKAADDKREARVAEQFGAVSPQLLRYTTDVLFRDLWLRPDLAPRDRSIVTVSALIAGGQTAQLASHLTRAMENGLTRDEAAELVTQVAFYGGWPNAFSALPVMKGVFESRGKE